ncbi:MAG: insulinase family protein [Alphaproteobacteria bacterium]
MNVLRCFRSFALAGLMLSAGSAMAQTVTAPTPAPAAAVDPALAAAWPQLAGDLPLDPDVKLGVLPNGLRYVIESKKSPPGKAALRLVINAGSMQEAHDQEGLAHFLEHMAYRGSTHVPMGDTIKMMERLGLRMGADTNAATGPDRTLFKFNLPRNDDESIDTGLMLLREIASELTLDQSAMNQERGVILAEQRLRDQPVQTLMRAQMAWQLGDHPYARSPGGRNEVIQTAKVDRMRAFYDAYYRPERALVVIAGDVDPAAMVEKIRTRFGDWKGRGAPGGDPKPLTAAPKTPPVTIAVVDGMPISLLSLQWFRPYSPTPPTSAGERSDLVDELGRIAISDRLSGVVERAGKPSQGISSVGMSDITGVWSGSTMSAGGVVDIDKTLDLMVTAYRQAAEYGISAAELQHALSLAHASRVRGEGGGHSGPAESLADMDGGQAMANAPFISSEINYNIFMQLAPTITLAEVNAVLKAASAGEPRLFYRGPVAPPGGAAALLASFNKAEAKPLTPYAPPEAKPWPYTEFGPPGAVAERSAVKDLNITFVRFANNVRLTVMKTAFRDEDTTVRVRLGLGRLALAKDHIDASDMGPRLWQVGGLGKLTPSEQALTLEGDSVIARVSQLDDAFTIDACGGGCLLPSKVERQFQLMTAMLTDPAFRTDEWVNTMRQADDSDKATPFSAQSVARFNIDRLVHPGDMRFVFNNAEMRKGWKSADAVAFMRPIVAKSPVEVIVVGDVDVDHIIELAAKTFGALPPRADIPESKGLRDVKFPPGVKTPVVLTHKGPVDQALAEILWPTTDVYADVAEHRRRAVLASLLQSRVTERVRMTDGKSYSPGAVMEAERELPGYGYMGIGVDAPPDAVDSVITTVEQIAAELTLHDVTADEFKRAMVPEREAERAAVKQNMAWINILGGVQTDPRGLNFVRSIEADYAAMTPASIRETAKRWLKPETEWKVKVVPEGSVKAAPAKPAAKLKAKAN